jgi:predicted  nucleic acid-binding Zn-ribbon protein
VWRQLELLLRDNLVRQPKRTDELREQLEAVQESVAAEKKAHKQYDAAADAKVAELRSEARALKDKAAGLTHEVRLLTQEAAAMRKLAESGTAIRDANASQLADLAAARAEIESLKAQLAAVRALPMVVDTLKQQLRDLQDTLKQQLREPAQDGGRGWPGRRRQRRRQRTREADAARARQRRRRRRGGGSGSGRRRGRGGRGPDLCLMECGVVLWRVCRQPACACHSLELSCTRAHVCQCVTQMDCRQMGTRCRVGSRRGCRASDPGRVLACTAARCARLWPKPTQES